MMSLIATTTGQPRAGHNDNEGCDDRRYSLLRGMGYAPQTDFTEGPKASVQWYQENRPLWESASMERP